LFDCVVLRRKQYPQDGSGGCEQRCYGLSDSTAKSPSDNDDDHDDNVEDNIDNDNDVDNGH
jgi:hypothetical protein